MVERKKSIHHVCDFVFLLYGYGFVWHTGTVGVGGTVERLILRAVESVVLSSVVEKDIIILPLCQPRSLRAPGSDDLHKE